MGQRRRLHTVPATSRRLLSPKMAKKHYGVNTEIVIFPRENHNLTRTGEPKHLVESLNWLCR